MPSHQGDRGPLSARHCVVEWQSGKAYIYLFCNYVYLCGYVSMSEDAQAGQKNILDPLELEVQAVMSCSMWVQDDLSNLELTGN